MSGVQLARHVELNAVPPALSLLVDTSVVPTPSTIFTRANPVRGSPSMLDLVKLAAGLNCAVGEQVAPTQSPAMMPTAELLTLAPAPVLELVQPAVWSFTLILVAVGLSSMRRVMLSPGVAVCGMPVPDPLICAKGRYPGPPPLQSSCTPPAVWPAEVISSAPAISPEKYGGQLTVAGSTKVVPPGVVPGSVRWYPATCPAWAAPATSTPSNGVAAITATPATRALASSRPRAFSGVVLMGAPLRVFRLDRSGRSHTRQDHEARAAGADRTGG